MLMQPSDFRPRRTILSFQNCPSLRAVTPFVPAIYGSAFRGRLTFGYSLSVSRGIIAPYRQDAFGLYRAFPDTGMLKHQSFALSGIFTFKSPPPAKELSEETGGGVRGYHVCGLIYPSCPLRPGLTVAHRWTKLPPVMKKMVCLSQKRPHRPQKEEGDGIGESR